MRVEWFIFIIKNKKPLIWIFKIEENLESELKIYSISF